MVNLKVATVAFVFAVLFTLALCVAGASQEPPKVLETVKIMGWLPVTIYEGDKLSLYLFDMQKYAELYG